jgi:transcriptional regulator with XRE-family HTH domain
MGVFGERLRECRLEQGLSQAALARALGMPRQQINNYEGGRFEPSLKIARKIADALQVSLDTLTTPRTDAVASQGRDKRQQRRTPPAPPARPSRTAAVDLGPCLLENLDDIATVLATIEGEDWR